jgi:hypothetical protein
VTAGAVTALAIFFGMLGCIGLALMMWAKLMNPEQIRIEWDDEDDPDRLL